MRDSQCIQVKVEAGVLELCAIVTSDVLDLDAIVRHGTIGESSEDILHFILVEDYMHPCISRIIMNNDESIEASSGSESRVVSRAKEIHMKQLEGACRRHDCLRGMFCSSHLPGFTGTTQMILLEFDALDAYDMLSSL